jgi:hypothetical protein
MPPLCLRSLSTDSSINLAALIVNFFMGVVALAVSVAVWRLSSETKVPTSYSDWYVPSDFPISPLVPPPNHHAKCKNLQKTRVDVHPVLKKPTIVLIVRKRKFAALQN